MTCAPTSSVIAWSAVTVTHYKKTLLIGWIDPGACDDTGTIARANLVLVSIHQGVQRGPIHYAFLGQQRFERLDSKCWVGGNHLVVVAVIVFLGVSKVLRCRPSPTHPAGSPHSPASNPDGR